jgi:hypothetical protein
MSFAATQLVGFGAGGLIYATLDSATNVNSGTLSGGDLVYDNTSASGNLIRSTIESSSAKFYFEVTLTTHGLAGSGYGYVGVIQTAQASTSPTSLGGTPAGLWLWRDDANRANNGSSAALGSAWAVGNVIGVACDPANGRLWWAKNNTWAAGDPAAGTGASYTNLTGAIKACVGMMGTAQNVVLTANFGATAFTYTPPSGFSPLAV